MKYFPVKPYAHQLEAFAFCKNRDYYALLMEQGTAKTAVELNDTARRWEAGQIDTWLVLAPNGVQTNWILRELPQHMPQECSLRAAAWHSSMNKKQVTATENVLELRKSGELRLLTMNYEALNTQHGFKAAIKFLGRRGAGAKITADESSKVKNPSAQRTKALLRLKRFSSVRSIMTGTPVVNNPWDAFSQFNFLDENILETTSYCAFRAEYAELLPAGHGLLRHIRQRTGSAYDPQIVAKDPVTGLPRWRNLERLQRLIAPHSFRVLKADCLDLPDKVYTQRYFQMTPRQQQLYERLRDELQLVLSTGEISPVERLGAITKLSQVISGYFLVPGTTTVQRIMPLDKNPKFDILMDEVNTTLEANSQIIIWARFKAELHDIAAMLKQQKIPFVEYHGDVSNKNRTEAIDKFQGGEAKVFVGQQAAGGMGITLTAANTVIYFSNTWSLEDRLQSEDRAHRIGQKKVVRYVDLIAEDSMDGAIIDALRSKTDIARIITGDAERASQLLTSR